MVTVHNSLPTAAVTPHADEVLTPHRPRPELERIQLDAQSMATEETTDPPASLSEKLTTALKLINKTTNKLRLDIT